MAITVNHSVVAQLPHGATLADLKELVAAAETAGLPPSARLVVDHYRGNQLDPSYTTITVRQR